MKTTNAKAKAFQTPGGPKEIEKTQAPLTSARRAKKVTHAETSKIAVHGDDSPLADRDDEYCPPKPKDLPYESDVLPRGCLNFDAFKPGNATRGIYQHYYNPVDGNGKTKAERDHEAASQKAMAKADEQILKMMEEEWTVGDVPETFHHLRKRQPVLKDTKSDEKKAAPLSNKGPATITSRKAASALSVAPKASVLPPKTTKPKPTISFLSRPKPAPPASTNNHIVSAAASRSTIGYSKGRNASGALKKRDGGFTRSVSNVSTASDTTITPARFADQDVGPGSDEWRKHDFLRAFDVDDDDLERGLGGGLPECLRADEDSDEEFVMTLGGS
jgi:hypothetical protein